MEFARFDHPTDVRFRVATGLTVTEPTPVVIDGHAVTLPPGRVTADAGATWTFPTGAGGWGRPLLDPGGHPVLATLSLLVGLVLGTMGLPHVVVRFHTSPDGRAARRTAAITVLLLSAFYLFPGVYGALGARARAGAVPVGRDGHRRRGAAGPGRPGRRGVGVHRAALRGSVRGVPRDVLGLLLALSSAVAHDLVPGTTLRRLRLAPLASRSWSSRSPCRS